LVSEEKFIHKEALASWIGTKGGIMKREKEGEK